MMAPKKQAAKAKSKPTATKQDDAPKSEQVKEVSPAEARAEDKQKTTQEKPGKKRKKPADTDKPQKVPRRSGRGGPKSQPSQEQLLKFLLSKDAEALSRPEDESEYIRDHPKNRTYSSSLLSPYEELLSAVILSRPISHRLGLRTIRTVLNDPYNFTSAKETQAAGSEKHIKAVWDARTQHKEKTAGEIGQIADTVLSKFSSSDDKEGKQLGKVRSDCSHDADKERELLKSSIKGVGKTGLDIFFRRVQWLWEEAYPFIDDRTAQSLHQPGLPNEAEELEKLIERHWKDLGTKDLAGEDEKAKKRRAFSVVLERVTGSDLEGKSDAVMETAAAV